MSALPETQPSGTVPTTGGAAPVGGVCAVDGCRRVDTTDVYIQARGWAMREVRTLCGLHEDQVKADGCHRGRRRNTWRAQALVMRAVAPPSPPPPPRQPEPTTTEARASRRADRLAALAAAKTSLAPGAESAMECPATGQTGSGLHLDEHGLPRPGTVARTLLHHLHEVSAPLTAAEAAPSASTTRESARSVLRYLSRVGLTLDHAGVWCISAEGARRIAAYQAAGSPPPAPVVPRKPVKRQGLALDERGLPPEGLIAHKCLRSLIRAPRPMTAMQVSAITGHTPESCRVTLDALTRAGLVLRSPGPKKTASTYELTERACVALGVSHG